MDIMGGKITINAKETQ